MFDRPTKPKRPTQEQEEGKEEGTGGDKERDMPGTLKPVPEMGHILEDNIDFHSPIHPTPTHLPYNL